MDIFIILDVCLKISLLLLVLTAIVAIHEWGHFREAIKNKIQVDIFSIGFTFGLPYLSWRSQKYPDTEFRLCWGLVGGYVKMNREDIEKLPYRSQLDILYGGVKMNILSMFISLLILIVYSSFHNFLYGIHEEVNPWRVLLLLLTGATVACHFIKPLRWLLDHTLLPMVSVGMVALVLLPLLTADRFMPTSEQDPDAVVGQMGGLISLYSFFTPLLVSVTGFLSVFASLNFALATSNLLPFIPFDGGHVAKILLQQVGFKNQALRAVEVGGLCIALILILFALFGDAVRLFFMVKP